MGLFERRHGPADAPPATAADLKALAAKGGVCACTRCKRGQAQERRATVTAPMSSRDGLTPGQRIAAKAAEAAEVRTWQTHPDVVAL
jgi:hypothetical protein